MAFFDQLKEKAAKAVGAAQGGAQTRKIVLPDVPENVEALKASEGFTLKDPFVVAAYTVAALCVFPVDRDAAIEMLNFLKGPQPLSQQDIQFIRDRFMDGKDYVARAHFDGATPENDYTPSSPYTVTVKEQSNRRDQQDMITLYIASGGADSAHQVQLRHKPSTDEWFLWSYSSLLLSIRVPKSENPWA